MIVNKDSSLIYHGDLTIKVMHKDKCVKTIKGSNNGYASLFNFLVKCLSHEYSASLAPNNIRTFAFSQLESEEVPAWDDVANKAVYETSVVPFTQSSCVSKEETSTSDAVAIFTFLLPSSLLNAKNGIAIDTVAIYNDANFTDRDKPSAVFSFPIDKRLTEEEVNGNNLVILWEMKFENPTSTVVSNN